MSYNPTHVVVAVQRARDLKSKGSNKTNDAFVTIALEKNKFQTTVKEGAIDPEWYEECDLPLPERFDNSKLVLQVFHRNKLSIDEFLGHLELSLQNFDVYDAPRTNWYPLACKPGQNKTDPRGEIEVRVGFEVKKVQDLDTLSTASATSRRFKTSKIKNAASALGRKFKGGKHKTTDYVPDLTGGLDEGALDLEDIAENYGAEPDLSVSSKRKSSHSDSLAPGSPIFKRNPNSRGSKGLLPSPFGKRRSRADTDTSSQASNEEYRQKPDDTSESSSSPFTKTHRRIGSGSDSVVTGKPPRANRRLLQSKIKAQSTYDVSSSGQEFDSTPDRSALDDSNKPRTRSSLTNVAAADSVPDVQETSKDNSSEKSSSKRLSTISNSKLPDKQDKPVLIDDDDSDDSDKGLSHSAVTPVTIRKEEPTDLFARVNAQMQQEQEDEFNLTKHEVQPGEDVYTPVGDLKKSQPQATATSTPIVSTSIEVNSTRKTDDAKPAASKQPRSSRNKGGKSKPTMPPANVFDLLMNSDEPEYNVDDSLPGGGKKPITSPQKSEPNPFEDEEEPQVQSTELDASTASNPFGQSQHDDKPGNDEAESSNPFATKDVTNPFGKESAEVDANPFNDPSEARSNPFGESDEISSSANPFDEKPTDEPVTHKTGASNPFEESSTQSASNPFESDATSAAVDGTNPFAKPSATTEVTHVNNKTDSKNPFDSTSSIGQSSGNNPFEDDDDTAADSSNPFNRAGSSRFVGSSRQKKRSAPAPPKPKRTADEIQVTPIASKPKADAQTSSSAPEVEKPSVTSPVSNIASTKPMEISRSDSVVSSGSPHSSRMKKKAAPQVPVTASPVAGMVGDASRGRSASHNVTSASSADKEANKRRSGSYTSHVEQIIYDIDSPIHSPAAVKVSLPSTPKSRSNSRAERQPAIGAEAPEKPSEPKVMVDAAVQVTPDSEDNVPHEYRNLSKQELIEMIQKLKQQSRKKDDKVKDLEEYIDTLLLRVMTADPNLLVSHSCSKQAGTAYR